MQTKYSVLMPLWYKEKPEYLKASVESMAQQTVPPSEFVFVRDHEIPQELIKIVQDSTASILIKYVDADELFGQGLGAILAKGVEQCSCDLIARMDSDDIAFPDRCEKQLAIFNNNPELTIVGGTIAEFRDSIDNIISYRVLPENNKDIIKFAKFRNPFNHPTVMYRKDIILDIGNYNIHYKACEDYELWFRLLNTGRKGYNIQEPIVYFRDGGQLIKRRKDKKNYYFYILLKKNMYRNGFINWINLQVSINIQRIFYYSPYFIQKFIYSCLLRKRF
jgi:cellulose synthase/poly-beta-1,6-N-acetylglucosamine synthase-like glycosyltransferase